MGLFNNRIPERKWPDVAGSLFNEMKKYRAKWFEDFVDHVRPVGIGLSSEVLSPEIEDRISLLQFSAAAITVRENGYVRLKDFEFFIGLICIAITSKRMNELNKFGFELLAEPDQKVGLQKWALWLLPLVGNTEHNQKLAEMISQWGALLVIQSKIQTCEACLDPKGANAVRAMFR